jgi:SpoVK/Ycf46/Vps4 family AAA+-type ATPase
MSNPRYSRLVDSFGALAALDEEYWFLESLKSEADCEKAKEQHAAQLEAARRKAAEASQARPGDRQRERQRPSESKALKASWDTLIIPKSLRENLVAYCRILRDYEAYRAAGVKLPKGLLLFGPPGCGKTEIAKTLAAEGGLNFVALSTSDCKAMWIGWSAERLAKVFKEAREKQPSLIFVDELDIVCPPRGAYADSISQEFTGELLQQLDGISSDADAVFLVGATNRPDQVDSAIQSRFAERIEIPLPDARARLALLELFLGPIRFNGDRTHVIRALTLATNGKSGRDLRALVNQAVLAAVKRTSSPLSFALSETDFSLSTSSS